jgi:hypothetical protein
VSATGARLQLLGSIARRAFNAVDPPTPGGGIVGDVVDYSFATPSPMLLYVLAPTTVVIRAAIIVEVPFDVPTRLLLGSAATPDVLLDANGVVAGQYETDELLNLRVSELLRLTIQSAGPATQGSGTVLFEVYA